MGREKEYPKFCNCDYCISSADPFWARNCNDKQNHKRKLLLQTMPPKRANSNSSSTTSSDQVVGQKRKANHTSPELDLFLSNCKPGGLLVTAQNRSKSFFDESMDSALEALSYDDKMVLLDSAINESSAWQQVKKKYKDNYEELLEFMVDQKEWIDYVKDFKMKRKHNGVVLGFKLSDKDLDHEIKRTRKILVVAEEEKDRREKASKERIQAAIISKVSKKDLKGHTDIYDSTTSSSFNSIPKEEDNWANLGAQTHLADTNLQDDLTQALIVLASEGEEDNNDD